MTEPNPTNVPAPWEFPEDLEPYRDLLVNTGGNDPVDLINRLNREPHLLQTNLPVYLLAVAVQSQVALLRRLKVDGHLARPVATEATEGQYDHGAGYYIAPDAIAMFGAGGLFFPGIEVVHDVSDGYHTMGDLYDHRRALTRVVLLLADMVAPNTAADGGPLVWRSKAHHPDDNPMFEGYFIVGLNTMFGQISYHYKLKHWDEFEGVPEREHAPKWDGHTAQDSVDRLFRWLR